MLANRLLEPSRTSDLRRLPAPFLVGLEVVGRRFSDFPLSGLLLLDDKLLDRRLFFVPRLFVLPRLPAVAAALSFGLARLRLGALFAYAVLFSSPDRLEDESSVAPRPSSECSQAKQIPAMAGLVGELVPAEAIYDSA